MPYYRKQESDSSLSIEGPNLVAWLFLICSLAASGTLLALDGWGALPVAGGLVGAGLGWWALLRVLVQVRERLSE